MYISCDCMSPPHRGASLSHSRPYLVVLEPHLPPLPIHISIGKQILWRTTQTAHGSQFKVGSQLLMLEHFHSTHQLTTKLPSEPCSHYQPHASNHLALCGYEFPFTTSLHNAVLQSHSSHSAALLSATHL